MDTRRLLLGWRRRPGGALRWVLEPTRTGGGYRAPAIDHRSTQATSPPSPPPIKETVAAAQCCYNRARPTPGRPASTAVVAELRYARRERGEAEHQDPTATTQSCPHSVCVTTPHPHAHWLRSRAVSAVMVTVVGYDLMCAKRGGRRQKRCTYVACWGGTTTHKTERKLRESGRGRAIHRQARERGCRR